MFSAHMSGKVLYALIAFAILVVLVGMTLMAPERKWEIMRRGHVHLSNVSYTPESIFLTGGSDSRFWFVSSNDFVGEGVSLIVAVPRLERRISLEVGRAPWEGTFSNYANVLFDKETQTYYMYYRCVPRTFESAKRFDEIRFKQVQSTCVATSKSGLEFNRPELSFFHVDKYPLNNIIHRGPTAANFMVFLDTSAQNGTARFGAIGGVHGDVPGDLGIFAFTSSDGFNFTLLHDKPILTRADDHVKYHSYYDGLNTASWDRFARKYWIWLRRNEPTNNKHNEHFRRVQYTTFDNLILSKPALLRHAPVDDDSGTYYSACITRLDPENCSTCFFGVGITFPEYAPHLLLSRDGQNFSRPTGQTEYLPDPFLVSRKGHFAYRQSCVPGVVPSVNGKSWLLYHHWMAHKYDTPREYGEINSHVSVYSVPRWSFTKVFAKSGYFLTKPMQLRKSYRDEKLRLRFLASSPRRGLLRFDLNKCTEKGGKIVETGGHIWESEVLNIEGEDVYAGGLSSVNELSLQHLLRNLTCFFWGISLQDSSFHAVWLEP